MSTTLTHTARILKLLKAKGKVSNFELRKVAWRYPARILDLKHEGHRIRSVHDVGPRWFYIYEGHQDDEKTTKQEPHVWNESPTNTSAGQTMTS